MATLKKKVTLRTKVADEPANITPEIPVPNPENKRNGKGKWFGIAAVLVIVVAVVFFLLKPEKTDDTFIASDDVVHQQDVVTDVQQQENVDTEQTVPELVVEDKTIEENDNSDNVPNVVADVQVESVITNDTQKENIVSDKNNETDNSNTTISQQNNTLSTTESKTILPKESNLSAETIEAKAWLVIRGDFGNGKERKMKLGSDYSVIQNKVNELYKNGLVH